MSLAPEILASVARRLTEHAGLELPAWVVEARTTARIAALACAPEDYVELIGTARGANELGELIEAVRVGESSLFRHRPQITALVDVVVPVLRAKRRAVRVWSAGCASGEEPFTLAAVLGRALPGVPVQVIATDVSADALAAAREASFPAGALDDVPPEWRDDFVLDGDLLRVRPEVAERVTFERANLIDAAPPRNCDVVWCRNVLIYFSADARRRVIERLIASLTPTGYLFVGYSETLRDVTQLEAQRHDDTVFYTRREATSPGVESYRTPPYGTQLPRRTWPLDEDREPTAVGVPPPPRAVPRPTPAIKTAPIARVATPSKQPASKSSPYIAVPASKSSPHIAVPASKSSPAIAVPTTLYLRLEGQPTASTVTLQLAERLAHASCERLIVDLDAAELLPDDLAPVLRRARAAATTNSIALALRATKPGTRRWLSRHSLTEEP